MHTPEQIIRNPDLLPELIDGLNAKPAKEKYGAAKALIKISEEAPEILYPRFDFFASLLESDNRIFRWDALRIVANLARVDSENRIDAIFDRYFRAVRGRVMITAANAILGGATIAKAKPVLAGRIAGEILHVGHARYATRECRNVALGHAITAFDLFFDAIPEKEPVLRLVRRQLKNTRPAVRKKAAKFLAAHEPGIRAQRKARAARA